MKSLTPDISAFARLDFDRVRRTGFGETVYGPGKTSAQLAEIFAAFKRKGRPVLATRVSAEQAAALSDSLPDATYDPTSRTLASSWRTRRAKKRLGGVVAVLTGGTADMPAAEIENYPVNYKEITMKGLFDFEYKQNLLDQWAY